MFHVARTTIERHPQTLSGQLVANENSAESSVTVEDSSVWQGLTEYNASKKGLKRIATASKWVLRVRAWRSTTKRPL